MHKLLLSLPSTVCLEQGMHELDMKNTSQSGLKLFRFIKVDYFYRCCLAPAFVVFSWLLLTICYSHSEMSSTHTGIRNLDLIVTDLKLALVRICSLPSDSNQFQLWHDEKKKT